MRFRNRLRKHLADQVFASRNLFRLIQLSYVPAIEAFEFASAQLLINLMKGLLIKRVPSREEKFPLLPIKRFLLYSKEM
jgi:hypothetical protein